MRISYDPEADALSIILRDTTVTTRELAEGVVGEFDADGRLVGMELLDVSERLNDRSDLRRVVLEGIELSA